jgi:hypothetical protein
MKKLNFTVPDAENLPFAGHPCVFHIFNNMYQFKVNQCTNEQ